MSIGVSEQVMLEVVRVAVTFVLGLGACLYLAPRLAEAARRYGIVDAPDGSLKTQDAPVAYLGGLAVYIAVLLSLALALPFGEAQPAESPDLFRDPQVLAMLLAGTLFMSLGLLDDLSRLSVRDKLLGQFLAVAVLLKAGVSIQLVEMQEPVQWALSALWILACANAVNLLDVHDGLAVTVAGVSSLGFAVLGLSTGDLRMALIGAALAGACWGFLGVNRAPAQQYLGDCGSLFIGGLLGMLALMGRYDGGSGLGRLIAPIAFMALPFAEVAQLILARLRLGLNPFRGSRHHIAHRLGVLGLSAKQVPLLCGLIQLGFVGGALFGLRHGAKAELALAVTWVVACGVLLFLPAEEPKGDDREQESQAGDPGEQPIGVIEDDRPPA